MNHLRPIVTMLPFFLLTAGAPAADDAANAPAVPTEARAIQTQVGTSLSWPEQFEASGTTYQKEEAGGTAPIVVAASPTSIRFDWDGRKMITSFAGSCPPLLAPLAGSQDEGCAYFFVREDANADAGDAPKDKLYYVYTDQKMTDADPTDEPSCCLIEGFSMLGRHFPQYIEQFDAYMAANPPAGTGTPCDPPSLPPSHVSLGTPGGGYYAYDSESFLVHGDQSWVTPLGFGGVTPGEVFTVLEYDQAVAFPAAIAEIGLPAACRVEDLSACRSCVSETGPCNGPKLGDVFAVLQAPGEGGCVLCHNTFEKPRFPKELLHRFRPGACQ